ncbi:MAG TPA: alpha/beta fold hydrolase [Verrucomicrobiae bacterium]|nr:alpha/beta fold hydrolase [Verrucomicrobiae bacterium]
MKQDHSQRWRLGIRVGLVALLLSSAGCVTSRMAAQRIVTAPNRNGDPAGNRQVLGWWQNLNTNFLAQRIETPMRRSRVSVGPPAAELQILELPPQDYHVTVASKVETNRAGRTMLVLSVVTNHAVNFRPRATPATLFLLHGYMLSKESMIAWGLHLAQAGYRVVLVDLRGHGQSTGAQVAFGKYEVNDLRQMLDQLSARGECDADIGVLGFSYGATLALHWAAQDQRIRTVVGLAPYNQPPETFERLAKALKVPISRRSTQKATVLAAERLQLNWADWAGETAMRQLQVPVLLIGGGKDTVCPPEDLLRLREVAAAGSAKVRVIEQANHFSLPMAMHLTSEPIEAWFQETLNGRRESAARK